MFLTLQYYRVLYILQNYKHQAPSLLLATENADFILPAYGEQSQVK